MAGGRREGRIRELGGAPGSHLRAAHRTCEQMWSEMTKMVLSHPETKLSDPTGWNQLPTCEKGV